MSFLKGFKNLKKDEKGHYPFKVTFNYRDEDNGYTLGIPRNYNTNKVVSLVNSEATQHWIDKGNAVVMYGHGARDHAKGSFVAREHNPINGEVQLPVAQITKLKINKKNKNLIDFEGFFFTSPNNYAEDVMAMAKAGIGGFSFVWSVEKGIFYSADYVLVQNFSSNKIIMDSIDTICSDGSCSIDTTLDSILIEKDVPYSLYKKSKNLLMQQDEFQQIFKLKEKIESLNNLLENKTTYVKTLKEEIDRLKTDNKSLTRKNKSLTSSAVENGLRVEDDEVFIDGLDEILKVRDDEGIDLELVKSSLAKKRELISYPHLGRI